MYTIKLKVFIVCILISNALIGQKLIKIKSDSYLLASQLSNKFDKKNKVRKIDSPNKINDTLINKITIIGQAWGFLKYYHPSVAQGYFDWDSVLVKSLQDIINSDAENINNIIHRWFTLLNYKKKNLIRTSLLNKRVKLTPDFSWLNKSLLNDTMLEKLNNVKKLKRNYRNRYVRLNPGILNPSFDYENSYSTKTFPDANFRLLSLIRYWNIIQYFFPYRHLIDDNWNDILPKFIPVFLNSKSETEYKIAILSIISEVDDSHAQLLGNDEVIMKYKGVNVAPLRVRFIENKLVITGYIDNLGKTSGLRIGDIIESINNKSIKELINEKLSTTSGSNYKTQLRDLSRNLLRTNDTNLNIIAKRYNSEINVNISCYSINEISNLEKLNKKDTCYKLFDSGIAYLNLGYIKKEYLNLIMPEILKTRGLIIDLRSYPSDFVVFQLGKYLFRKPTSFVKFTNTSIQNPGYFTFSKRLKVGIKNKEYYKGKVVILVDENTQSSSEYHAMALKKISNAIIIGSASAGADGNISVFSLPGGIKTMMSGIGVYYPNGQETQRLGISPNIEIYPTISGILENRDELIEKAIETISK
jgi:C-terminal processing protease CtpA/Prc